MPALRARVWSHSTLRPCPTAVAASTAIDRMRPSSTERRDAPRSGGVPRRTGSWVNLWGQECCRRRKCVARGEGADAGDDEGDRDEDGAEVGVFFGGVFWVGPVIRLGFGQVSTPVGVHGAGLVL